MTDMTALSVKFLSWMFSLSSRTLKTKGKGGEIGDQVNYLPRGRLDHSRFSFSLGIFINGCTIFFRIFRGINVQKLESSTRKHSITFLTKTFKQEKKKKKKMKADQRDHAITAKKKKRAPPQYLTQGKEAVCSL